MNQPLASYDQKTEAVLLYSEDILTVQSDGKLKTLERRAYKILRPEGRSYGTVRIIFDSETRINSLHAWCIPAQGRDYEVTDKDSTETSLAGVEWSELVSDVRMRILDIPAADPGNVVGYEVEQEGRPYLLQNKWNFQKRVPVREARYSLELPSNWKYNAAWLNHPEVPPTQSANGRYEWVLHDVSAIRDEEKMPPWRGLAGAMFVSLVPPGSDPEKSLLQWDGISSWYLDLTNGRQTSSADLQQKVAALTAGSPNLLEKVRALARFVQSDVRYVAIELGIGGYQPHPASETFSHHFGDCKDKVTLLAAMLKQIGVDSYYVLVNTERGAISTDTPANSAFDHVIIAIPLKAGLEDPSLKATEQLPKLGNVLFFDPTSALTPFGQLPGQLQAGYGLLVVPGLGRLVQLPQLPSDLNGVNRTAQFSLSTNGTLTGEIHEVRLGERAAGQRYALRSASQAADRIKPIESILSHALANYQLTKATVSSLDQPDLPFEYRYSVVAENYAKPAANLLMVRPRVLGELSSGLLETKEPREYPVEFDAPERDSDSFAITLPAGYVVDDLPDAVDADFPFASYHSKTSVEGNVLRYTRSFEVKQLSVPLANVADLKKLYRIIATDEQNAAVLKPGSH